MCTLRLTEHAEESSLTTTRATFCTHSAAVETTQASSTDRLALTTLDATCSFLTTRSAALRYSLQHITAVLCTTLLKNMLPVNMKSLQQSGRTYFCSTATMTLRMLVLANQNFARTITKRQWNTSR